MIWLQSQLGSEGENSIQTDNLTGHTPGIISLSYELGTSLIQIDTSNAVESLYSHIYIRCKLKKGAKNFSILEGLEKLYLYCLDHRCEMSICSHCKHFSMHL